MPRIDTAENGSPTALNYGARDKHARYLLSRAAPRAGFISQLIAERDHLPIQRAKRQAPIADALQTYDAGGHLSDRRLPPGYRMNVKI